MFKNVIVRRPCISISEGITSVPQPGKPDYHNAIKQHDAYIDTLNKCGVSVTVLDALDNYPDACFIEDAAVLTQKCAIISNPSAETRKGEVEGLDKILAQFYEHIERIEPSGTLEGGDVMMVRNHFYIGLSERTDPDGAEQLIAVLKKYGYSGSVVSLDEMLHLKTGLAYLEDNILLAAGEFVDKPEFKTFKKIIIAEEESYSANSIRVNDYVILSSGYQKT